jgi:hypothetical protein
MQFRRPGSIRLKVVPALVAFLSFSSCQPEAEPGAPAAGGSGGSQSAGGGGGRPSAPTPDPAPMPPGSGGSGGAGGSGGGGGGAGSAGSDAAPPAGAPEAGAPAGPAAQPFPPDEPLPACKRTTNVSGGGLAGAIAAAMPGDCLLVADGNYAAPTIGARGMPGAPIVIRAANRLKAVFTGGTLQLRGAAHVVVEGFAFTGAVAHITDSNHCRLSRCKISVVGGNWVTVDGNSDSNRIDRCEMGPKNSDGNMIRPTGLSTRTRIDRNYLHDFSGGGNGRETLRLGCCGATFDNHESFNLVEHNLFSNCSGEPEIISVKTSAAIIRYNTFRGSTGNVTLRAGKRSSVYGNHNFGSGIRIYDDDQKVYNNYVEGSPGPAIIVGSGQPPGNAQVRRAFIVHNTLIGTGALFGHGRRPQGDLDTTFANNIIRADGPAISFATPSINPRYQGNLVFGGPVGVTAPPEAFRVADPQLQPGAGAQAPAPGSPAIDGATEIFPFVMEDIEGQPRDRPDLGADELSGAPRTRRPLTPADVGPNAP